MPCLKLGMTILMEPQIFPREAFKDRGGGHTKIFIYYQTLGLWKIRFSFQTRLMSGFLIKTKKNYIFTTMVRALLLKI